MLVGGDFPQARPTGGSREGPVGPEGLGEIQPLALDRHSEPMPILSATRWRLSGGTSEQVRNVASPSETRRRRAAPFHKHGYNFKNMSIFGQTRGIIQIPKQTTISKPP